MKDKARRDTYVCVYMWIWTHPLDAALPEVFSSSLTSFSFYRDSEWPHPNPGHQLGKGWWPDRGKCYSKSAPAHLLPGESFHCTSREQWTKKVHHLPLQSSVPTYVLLSIFHIFWLVISPLNCPSQELGSFYAVASPWASASKSPLKLTS